MPWFDLKTNSRKLIRDNAPKIIFVSIVFIILVTIMSELRFRLPDTAGALDRYMVQLESGEPQSLSTIYSYFRPSGIPLAILLMILASVLDAGYMSYCLKISRGNEGEYKDIFDGFLFAGKIILIKIISDVLILLWSTLFIFPGVAAYYRYRQAYYILLDDPQKSALQCIRESKHLMKGRKLDLFLLDLTFIGWIALSFLFVMLFPLPFPLPLVLIWLSPYYGLTTALFYNRLINSLAI